MMVTGIGGWVYAPKLPDKSPSLSASISLACNITGEAGLALRRAEEKKKLNKKNEGRANCKFWENVCNI